VFEDVAKTLTTTNTTWAGTVAMCRRLAGLAPEAEGQRAFPAPAEIVAIGPERLGAEARMGYRAAYLYDLAREIESGNLDVEAWRGGGFTSEELWERLRRLRGFGPYAAGNMLKLLGHYDRLAIDTAVRGVFQKQLNDGKPASEKDIAAYYERFGRWRGLVSWLDVMRVYLLPFLEKNAQASPFKRTE